LEKYILKTLKTRLYSKIIRRLTNVSTSMILTNRRDKSSAYLRVICSSDKSRKTQIIRVNWRQNDDRFATENMATSASSWRRCDCL